MKNVMRRFRDEAGFTLIELMGVAVVLTILALVAVPTVLGSINKAKVNTAQDSALQMASALRRYYAAQMDNDSNGEFPAAATQITTESAFVTAIGQDYWDPPADTAPTHNYVFVGYKTDGANSHFVLCVQAKDRNGTIILVDDEGTVDSENVAAADCDRTTW